ncbi:hypothetical protein LX64_01726 [Chitinophaga skermanii]|uniref:Uncharacterized protein n=1 Tax=Chitinophaga skermanii TaxID=331697 RepID=A0A327QPU5_9BACT|nr:hypothetical protein [Chitinophaga skermanii]RAJ06599.1 hypothetical protein LX64_01726 [Chitinophaga skermanii]
MEYKHLRKPRTAFVFLLLAIGSTVSVAAQDKIYFASEVKDGTVAEITADKIKFKNPANPGPVYTVAKNKVLLAFNSTGRFIAVPALETGNQTAVNDFISNKPSPVKSDRVVTKAGEILTGQLAKEDDQSIYLKTPNGDQKIDKSNTVLLLLQSGQHKLFADATTAANILGGLMDKMFMPPAQPANTQTLDIAYTKPAPKAPSPEVPKPVPAEKENNKPTTAAQRGTSEFVDGLGEVSFNEYERKALQKTEDLNIYLKMLCDKNADWQDANKAIDQAVNLFVNEDASVETSVKGKAGATRYKIREYLKRIKLIKYDKVDIEWTNIQYVSKLKKGPDGNYYGIITFEQVFRGYMDKNVVYSDVTRKNVEVVLKTYNKSIEGKNITAWDVLLSDIGVVVTKG